MLSWVRVSGHGQSRRGEAVSGGAHGRAAGSLPFRTRPRWASPCPCRDGVQRRMVPVPAPRFHTAREHGSRAALSEAAGTCPISQVPPGPRQGGAELGKRNPEVSSPPPAQTGEDTNGHPRADAATAPTHLPGPAQPPARKEVLSVLFFLVSIFSVLEQL